MKKVKGIRYSRQPCLEKPANEAGCPRIKTWRGDRRVAPRLRRDRAVLPVREILPQSNRGAEDGSTAVPVAERGTRFDVAGFGMTTTSFLGGLA